MLTVRHRERRSCSSATVPALSGLLSMTLALALSACSSSSPTVTPVPSPSTSSPSPSPTPTASASSPVSAAQLRALDTQLSALSKDPALPAAAQASKDVRTLRQLKAQADFLSKSTGALPGSGCAQAPAITKAAISVQQQSGQVLADIPKQLSAVQATIGSLSTKAQALQKTIQGYTTAVGPGGDPTTINQLQSYTTAAGLLMSNVQAAQATLTDVPKALPKLSPITTELQNVVANVAKRCH